MLGARDHLVKHRKQGPQNGVVQTGESAGNRRAMSDNKRLGRAGVGWAGQGRLLQGEANCEETWEQCVPARIPRAITLGDDRTRENTVRREPSRSGGQEPRQSKNDEHSQLRAHSCSQELGF